MLLTDIKKWLVTDNIQFGISTSLFNSSTLHCMSMRTNAYQLADFEVATLLLTLGFKLLDIDKANPKKASFIFEESPKIQETIDAYFNDTLSVNPRILFMQSKGLKNRLYLWIEKTQDIQETSANFARN